MEWKEVKLGDITQLVIDYRGKTPLKLGADWSDSGYRALSAKNIKTGKIVAEDSIRFVDETLYKKWMKDEVERGDILITSEAPFGQIFFWDSDEKIVLSQRLFDVRIKDGICKQFVYYYMTTNEYQKELDGRATGTTVIGLRQPELLKTTIKLPSYEVQDKIASILSSLDSKIETNNKINAKLEEMAQALFKSWFVDFEPFKDGEFVDSELGMIPKGWKVGKLSEIAEVTKSSVNPGKTPEKLFSHYSLPAFDESKMPAMQYGSEIMSNKLVFGDKTTLLSKLNPHIKRVWFVNEVKDNPICSTEFIPVKANDETLCAFVHCCINSDHYYNKAVSAVNGATTSHQRIHPDDVMNMEIAYNDVVAKQFSIAVYPMLEKIANNITESSRLASLRDTLLPKLMSGAIEI